MGNQMVTLTSVLFPFRVNKRYEASFIFIVNYNRHDYIKTLTRFAQFTLNQNRGKNQNG